MGSVFTKDELDRVGVDVLTALGAPKEVASAVAESLVLSNLMGHDSHGIVRLIQYSGWVRDGQIQPAALPEVVTRKGATAVVDGAWGFGQPAARLATDLAVERARDQGIAAVTIKSCNHIGRLGEYVATLADAGMMGMAFCNAGPVVAPFGGAGRVMGTNPFAWGVPRAGNASVVLDFATANVAEGKLNIARSEGRTVAPGSIVDRDGKPSIEPNDFYAGGALLPFGAHKGSGMSMLIELTGGLLSGMGAACAANYKGGNGTLVLAVDVSSFADLEGFLVEVEDFCRDAKAIGKGASGSGSEILVPGELESRTRAKRETDGVEVGDEIRRQITELSDELGVGLARFELR
ncbi:MAG: dehydrogenase [Acidimicrobiaceae bacterium]|nr:dehydrogenase [Acidimicrobiaceae bacterium]